MVAQIIRARNSCIKYTSMCPIRVYFEKRIKPDYPEKILGAQERSTARKEIYRQYKFKLRIQSVECKILMVSLLEGGFLLTTLLKYYLNY